MRSAVLAVLLGVLFIVSSCTTPEGAANNSAPSEPQSKPSGTREPVLVELFTSEGCGNCPPADRALAFLETQQPVAGADVITLGYHVDYFNDRGWKDEYSSAEYTRRQNLYAMRLNQESVYTPQMIVDGKVEFVGSDAAKANAAIATAAKPGKPVVTTTVSARTAEVNITGFGPHTLGTAVLAAAEDRLVSNVKAGNNRGRTISHISVVRKLQSFGKVPEKATEFKGRVELPSDSSWKQENMKYVVYVQEDMSGRIIAVGRVKPGE